MESKSTDLNLDSNHGQEIIVIRDVEGAQAIEDYIQGCWNIREDDDKIMNSSVMNEFSKLLFGKTFSETKLEFTMENLYLLDTPEKQEEWTEFVNDFDSLFQTTDAGEDETVEILLKLGVDFRSAQGHPLKMTRYLKRQTEAAATKRMGQLPEVGKLRADQWESKLLAEKTLFERKKHMTK